MATWMVINEDGRMVAVKYPPARAEILAFGFDTKAQADEWICLRERRRVIRRRMRSQDWFPLYISAAATLLLVATFFFAWRYL